MYELLEDMIGNAINIFFDLDYNFYNFLNDIFLYIIFAVILIEGKNYISQKKYYFRNRLRIRRCGRKANKSSS